MRSISFLIAAVTSMLLIGCATQSPQTTSTGWTNEEIAAAVDGSNQRYEQSLSNPIMDPLRNHIPLTNPESASIQQIASKKKPNEAEKESILYWDRAITVSSNEIIEIYRAAGAPAPIVENYQTLLLAQKQAKARLWAGQISFGEYINQSIANRAKYTERNKAIAADSRAAEMQQAQLAAQQTQAAAQALMLFNQASRQRMPVQTNCVRIGGQTSCTSY